MRIGLVLLAYLFLNMFSAMITGRELKEEILDRGQVKDIYLSDDEVVFTLQNGKKYFWHSYRSYMPPQPGNEVIVTCMRTRAFAFNYGLLVDTDNSHKPCIYFEVKILN